MTHLATADHRTHVVPLAAGTLHVEVQRADLPLGILCGFASRRNAKRPWLFVSRVLGRHLPVKPAVMRSVHRRLAAKLPADLPGPIVAIGMAETAVCLGQGVHAAYVQMTRRDDVLFQHSTRYRLSHPLALTFEESHSHATSHLLYEPAAPEDSALFDQARTLVLIDDEASTGATFLELAEAARQRMPKLEAVVCLVITDWMGDEARTWLLNTMPVPCGIGALLAGRYRFEPNGAPPPVMPGVTGDGTLKDHLLPMNFGRLGLRRPPLLPEHVVRGLHVRRGETMLVLGTGEFCYPPFQLARLAAARGADVRAQATTRSPVLLGNDIEHAIEFRDAYQDDIPNFLYAARRGQYDRVLVCYETPPETAQTELIQQLGAEPVYFCHG